MDPYTLTLLFVGGFIGGQLLVVLLALAYFHFTDTHRAPRDYRGDKQW